MLTIILILSFYKNLKCRCLFERLFQKNNKHCQNITKKVYQLEWRQSSWLEYKFLDLLFNSCNSWYNPFGAKYARMFVCRHYLFQEVSIFPRATLLESWECEEQINVQGQMCFLFILSYLSRVLIIGSIPRIFPSFTFFHVVRLD